ncbi:hypothetical protein FGG08_006278 [Glutinoglossum americanum]|uniref:Uncharacterized protein n=1 Tax=Glutinoglossum americanum TaxID=1670608 RepID=A0A9P8I1U6_9PEZI|nr:hypothetical protein FGG08_006278 [Glutinoglossum americanum]
MDGYTSSRPSKFHFKSKSKSKSDDDLNTTHRKRHHTPPTHEARRDHSYSSKRRRSSRGYRTTDDPTLYDDIFLPNSRSSQFPSPEAAFRESLFDAMADDEGAAYWEGVYGQPIHVYSKEKLGPNGELEQMTDEEYTAYVRAKMYEKTHQHMIEERARREKAKGREREMREAGRRMQQEHEMFQKRIDETLRRGEERRLKKRAKEQWANYLKAWEDLKSTAPSADTDQTKQIENARHRIPWPVDAGRFSDISREAVERFFLSMPFASRAPEEPLDLLAILKAERVRWHPDKIQQRFAGEGLDRGTMAAVTAVFQVVDRLWLEMRDKKAHGT